MKTRIILLATLFAGVFGFAQDNCAENLSLMISSVKAKDASAYDYLTTLRKECPSFHKGIYAGGIYAIKHKIKTAETETEKQKYVQDLLALYDEYKANFPNDAKGIAMQKGLALFNYKCGTENEIYTYFDNGFKNDCSNFNSTRALYAYFEILVNNFKAGNKNIQLQEVFDKYDDINDKLALLKKKDSDAMDVLLAKEEAGQKLSSKETKKRKKYAKNLEDITTVTQSMDAIVVELSSCEKLIPFYRKNFDANKQNEIWLKRAADRLESKECDNAPLFSEISEALYNLNPNADAAYKLGVVQLQKKNKTKALEFFNKAAGMYNDGSKKAGVYMKIASMYKHSNKSKARTYAKKALAVKPSYGRAYLLIAQIYAASINDCGTNPFEKRAMYWLAAQYADKAANVDGSVRGTALKMASSYRAAAPSRTEIFQSGKAGQRIAFNCWVGESVVVPNL